MAAFYNILLFFSAIFAVSFCVVIVSFVRKNAPRENEVLVKQPGNVSLSHLGINAFYKRAISSSFLFVSVCLLCIGTFIFNNYTAIEKKHYTTKTIQSHKPMLTMNGNHHKLDGDTVNTKKEMSSEFYLSLHKHNTQILVDNNFDTVSALRHSKLAFKDVNLNNLTADFSHDNHVLHDSFIYILIGDKVDKADEVTRRYTRIQLNKSDSQNERNMQDHETLEANRGIPRLSEDLPDKAEKKLISRFICYVVVDSAQKFSFHNHEDIAGIKGVEIELNFKKPQSQMIPLNAYLNIIVKTKKEGGIKKIRYRPGPFSFANDSFSFDYFEGRSVLSSGRLKGSFLNDSIISGMLFWEKTYLSTQNNKTKWVQDTASFSIKLYKKK